MDGILIYTTGRPFFCFTSLFVRMHERLQNLPLDWFMVSLRPETVYFCLAKPLIKKRKKLEPQEPLDLYNTGFPFSAQPLW